MLVIYPKYARHMSFSKQISIIDESKFLGVVIILLFFSLSILVIVIVCLVCSTYFAIYYVVRIWLYRSDHSCLATTSFRVYGGSPVLSQKLTGVNLYMPVLFIFSLSNVWIFFFFFLKQVKNLCY